MLFYIIEFNKTPLHNFFVLSSIRKRHISCFRGTWVQPRPLRDLAGRRRPEHRLVQILQGSQAAWRMGHPRGASGVQGKPI